MEDRAALNRGDLRPQRGERGFKLAHLRPERGNIAILKCFAINDSAGGRPERGDGRKLRVRAVAELPAPEDGNAENNDDDEGNQ